MNYLHHVIACNTYDLTHFRPFVVADRRVGWIRTEFMTRLSAFPHVFHVRDDVVAMHDSLSDCQQRTEAVADILRRLAQVGGLPTLRDEFYAVNTRFGEPPLLLLDRAVVPLFGVRAYGIHVNGIVRDGSRSLMWIGRRAADKAVAPNKLDNIVAGGQPAHLSLHANLLKEAAEEADIPAELAAQSRPVGLISYCMEAENGLKPDVQFCYDLDLPADFQPRNTDGEISEFMLWPVERVAEAVRGGDDFKFNVNLVIIDYLIRHGFLSPDDEPDYLALVMGLKNGTPRAET